MGTAEQRGTAGQDLEVMRLRSTFRKGWSEFGKVAIEWHASKWGDFPVPTEDLPWAPAIRWKVEHRDYNGEDWKASGGRTLWTCTERSAKRNSKEVSEKTYDLSYEFGYPDTLYNKGTGFGKVFAMDGDIMVGRPKEGAEGTFVTEDIVRYEAERPPIARLGYEMTIANLVIERVTYPIGARLSAADEKKYEQMATQYDRAVTAEVSPDRAEALAVAYVYCTTPI